MSKELILLICELVFLKKSFRKNSSSYYENLRFLSDNQDNQC